MVFVWVIFPGQAAFRGRAQAGIQSPWAARRSVDEGADLAEVELGRGVGVHVGGVIEVGDVLFHQRADGQLLHVDLGAHERHELRRDVVHDRRLHAVAVDEAGHLDRRAVRQLRRLKPRFGRLP
jgi:hypothetical protein